MATAFYDKPLPIDPASTTPQLTTQWEILNARQAADREIDTFTVHGKTKACLTRFQIIAGYAAIGALVALWWLA